MSSSEGCSQVHHSGTARPNHGMGGNEGEFGSVEEDGDEDTGRPPTTRRRVVIYPRSVTQRSWKRREGVVRRSCISIIIP